MARAAGQAAGDSVASTEPSAPLLKRSLAASTPSATQTPTAEPAPRLNLPLDELSLKFAIWARISAGYCVDIGCGEGIATAAALSRGGRVVAVDVEQRTLETLRSIVPAELYGRLKCLVGELPDLELPNGDFSAVHVARDLHRLSPEGLHTSLRKMFDWLHPNGKVFLGTPLTAGATHLREEDDLRRELSAAGFIIEEISSQPTPGNRTRMRCAAVARRP